MVKIRLKKKDPVEEAVKASLQKIYSVGDAMVSLSVKMQKPKTDAGKKRITVKVSVIGTKYKSYFNMNSPYSANIRFVAEQRGK